MRSIFFPSVLLSAVLGSAACQATDLSIYEGLYRPQGNLASEWNCQPEFLGQAGGALGIVDGHLEGVESRCELTAAQKSLNGSSTDFVGLCSGEGENYRDIITLSSVPNGVAITRGENTVVWKRCEKVSSPSPEAIQNETKPVIPWIVTEPQNSVWTSGWGQGINELWTADAMGNSVTFTCNSLNENGRLRVELNGESISGGDVEFDVDGDVFHMSAFEKGGEVNTKCTVCADNYTALWKSVALGKQLTITDSKGQSAAFSLKGSKKALGLTPCAPVGRSSVGVVRPDKTGVGTPILPKTSLQSALNAKKDHGYSVSTVIARRGSRSQRFELRHGECGKNKWWDDCNTDRQRIERSEYPKNRMQRVGQKVWYGWSMYLPEDFPSLGKANTVVGQVKINNWRTPLWDIAIREERVEVHFPWHDRCLVGELQSFRGKWNDVTVYADYSSGKSNSRSYGNTLEIYVDGELACSVQSPLVTREMLNSPGKHYIFFKYGIYNSYVSRWLNENKTKDVLSRPFVDKHRESGLAPESIAASPFRYDWGVKLPTLIIYYDEMRFGLSREEVDIRMLETRSVPALD